MKVVAVSQRVDVHPGRGETRDALDQAIVDFLAAAGCLTIPVPNSLDRSGASRDAAGEYLTAWLTSVAPDAVLLSGGNDIGQHPERDATEDRLLRYAEQRRSPVLGFCRGMQMLAHRAGTGLISVEGHVRTRHIVHGLISAEVNSFHDMALAGCPDGYQVLARSADGQIEAIGHTVLPWEGWMWHPEREVPFSESDLHRARMIFGA